jgi:hypothetical protein
MAPPVRGLVYGAGGTPVNSATDRWNPFTHRPFVGNGVLRTLIGRKNPQNALIELTNALADASRVQHVTLDTVERINGKYRIDLHRHCRAGLEAAYGDYICSCLRDRHVTTDEVEGLRHLQALFGLEAGAHRRIVGEAGERHYRAALKEIIADGTIDADERAFLDRLSNTTGLSKEVRDRIYAEEAKSLVRARFNDAISDAELSPDEEQDYQALAKGLGVGLDMDDAARAKLEELRLMWRIRYGELPVVDAGVHLQRQETCHFSTPATWNEMRSVRVGVNYMGPTLRIKIAKGLYWRMGQFRGAPITKDMLVKVDTGTVFITNKRVIFSGPMRSNSVRLDRVLDITPYADGVGIQKDTGKSPIYGFDRNINMFCAVLARVIGDFGGR